MVHPVENGTLALSSGQQRRAPQEDQQISSILIGRPSPSTSLPVVTEANTPYDMLKARAHTFSYVFHIHDTSFFSR